MSRPLAGVRVVDFGHYIAGPMAALLLADAGADVVRVERPGAARTELADAFFRRGKRRVALDLHESAGRDAARALIGRADVVVENFRPGVMDRLGVGPSVSRAANDRLVYCSLPGFAEGDELAAVRGWEGVIHAATAGFRPLNEHWDPTGRTRADVEDRSAPLFTPITTASNFAAMLGATMIVAALFARERTGRGQRVEVPLAEAMIEAYSTMINNRVYDDSVVPPGVMLRDLSYRCADGGMIDLSPHPKFVFRLLEQCGVAAEWERRGLIDRATTSFHADRRADIQDFFATLIASRSAEDWDAIATELELPLAMVRTPEQWLASDHAMASGAVVRSIDPDDPERGRLVMPGTAVDLTGAGAAASVGDQVRADSVGVADAADVLGEWGAPATSLTTLTSSTPVTPRTWTAGERPLDGVRILDLTQAVAGPTATRLLADLGADVIKLGSTTPGPTDGIVGHLHRGKRTMLLDTVAPAGRDLLDRLLRGTDAFVTNFTASAAERYGVDHRRLSALEPDLVYCSITAYGQRGPWARRRAYENQCNATTGMSWWYGAPLGWTLYQPTPINDAATGILAAFATITGLFARGRGAGGALVATSLAQASTWHQATSMVRPDTALTGAMQRAATGSSALDRLYPTVDGAIFLAARRDDVRALAEVIGIQFDESMAETAADADGPLAEAIAAGLRSRPGAEWDRLLDAAGIDARVVYSLDEATAFHAARGLVYFEPGPTGDLVARPGVGRWLTDTPPAVGDNPGPVGSQGVDILRELGLDDDEIDGLAVAGTICLPDHLPQVSLRA